MKFLCLLASLVFSQNVLAQVANHDYLVALSSDPGYVPRASDYSMVCLVDTAGRLEYHYETEATGDKVWSRTLSKRELARMTALEAETEKCSKYSTYKTYGGDEPGYDLSTKLRFGAAPGGELRDHPTHVFVVHGTVEHRGKSLLPSCPAARALLRVVSRKCGMVAEIRRMQDFERE